ncbi:class I SAM-dependent methyltransferase [Candidatus Magnetominusculus dajiuhuensis]|uniref:class I SAM-dependent methyltransferase n=1 Tax=Candidatus Magnetominusculus dajiuhuensis TaxID=3137712 RepID=UPI003B42CC23
MQNNEILTNCYDRKSSERFWDPLNGPVGRDAIVLPLIHGASGNVLEYGFGSGSLLFSLAKERRFHNLIGIDISEVLVKRAMDIIDNTDLEWVKKIKLLTPQNDTIPQVADGSMDLIISVATIEHVLDPYIVLDELHRVARENAIMVCSVPNYAYLKNRFILLLGRLPKTGTDDPVESWRTCGWDGMHIHTFTKDAFATLLRSCGWEPVRWTGWGERYKFLFKLRQKLPSLLSGEIMAVCKKIEMRTAK